MNRESLKALIMRHEGVVLKPYKDSRGIVTLGCGRNIQDVGITEAEAMMMLDNDLSRVVSDCRSNFCWFDCLDDSRQNVVASMVFNMGIEGFKAFKKLIFAIEHKDWGLARSQMLNSQWASQVKTRAVELAQMMLQGDTVH